MNKGIVTNGCAPAERFGGLVAPLPLVAGRDSFSSALAAVA
jgi:two-component system nitrate/nitrite response regulator NarL